MNRARTPPNVPPVEVERCARCGGDVAAWRVVVEGRVYCTAYCARVDGAVAELAPVVAVLAVVLALVSRA